MDVFNTHKINLEHRVGNSRIKVTVIEKSASYADINRHFKSKTAKSNQRR